VGLQPKQDEQELIAVEAGLNVLEIFPNKML
jgi:hypothetical protein